MTGKDMNAVTRRFASLTNHIVPPSESGPGSSSVIGLGNAAAPFNDSYHRVHGEVPSHPPVWRVVADDSGKGFTDIIYEKAVGEGIAKVIGSARVDFCVWASRREYMRVLQPRSSQL